MLEDSPEIPPGIEIGVKDVPESQAIIDATEEKKKARENRENMEFVESKLNKLLYNSWYRKYISYMFWSNIGTPLNLTITLLSALTATSSSNSAIFTGNTVAGIQISILVISALNTFFRPYVQANDNLKFMLEIQKHGAKFDEIYYTPKSVFTSLEYKEITEKYKIVFVEFNKYASENSLEQRNIFIDLIFLLLVNTVLRKKEEDKEWVKLDYI